MTHTRGPWHTAKRSNGIAIEHREEKSYGWLQHEVALVYPLAEPEKATGAANARLIAAAPDLLAALEDAVEALTEARYYPSELKRFREAISKAKGDVA